MTAQASGRTSRLPDSWAAATGGAIPPVEESPGSTGTRCRLTAGGGDPRESATENKPPAQEGNLPRGRAKRCGKSAPRLWQQGRQGKPHREQDRIGATAFARPQGLSRPVARVGRARRAARRVPEEWSSRACKRADRTRLTGRLAFYSCTVPLRRAPDASSTDLSTIRTNHEYLRREE